MVFETDLTEKDFQDLNWLMSKRVIYLFSILIGLFFGGTLFAKAPHQLPLICVLVIVLFFIALFLGRTYILRRSKNIYHRANVSEYLKLVLDERGIVQTSNAGDTELLWEDVYAVRKNKNSYFVFLNQRQAFYFQKRNFKEGQEQEFLHMIRQMLPKNKIKI